MSTFEVTTDLIIHCKVKVRVEADDKAAAIDAVADMMPNNFNPGSREGWKATVKVTPPKSLGLSAMVSRGYHFEQASGADKAKKVTA